MTAPNPTATLRPTGFAYEAAGELAIDTIRGMTMTLLRRGNAANLTVRNNGTWRIGSGRLDLAFGDTWRGRLTIHGVPWNVEAVRDAKAREWRMTLSIPAEAFA
jgi:hypothetical protein